MNILFSDYEHEQIIWLIELNVINYGIVFVGVHIIKVV